MGIQRLVTLDVDLLGFPVQVRRNRDRSADLQHAGKRRSILPVELHHPGLPVTAYQPGFQPYIRSIRSPIQGQDIVLPLFGIADNALPCTNIRRRKSRGILHRLYRLQAEDLDVGTGRPLEMHTGRNHLRVIEDHQSVVGKQVGQLTENVLIHLTALIMKQLG